LYAAFIPQVFNRSFVRSVGTLAPFSCVCFSFLSSKVLFGVESNKFGMLLVYMLVKSYEGWEAASPCSQTPPPPSRFVTAPAVATTTGHDFRSAST
jgi:hypothetical protein